MRPHGIMFHHFWDDRHVRGQGAIGGGEFRRMIEFLGPERILPATEWVRRAVGGTLRPWDICLTFDDNLKCQWDVAVPVLREYGLTAFFFVYTSVLRGVPERLEIYRQFRTTGFEGVEQFYEAFFAAVSGSPYGAEVEGGMEEFDPSTYLSGFPFYTEGDRRFRFVRDQVLGPAKYFAVMEQMLVAAGVDVAEAARGLWMSAEQVRALHGEGHVIGLHSDTHPTRVADLSPGAQEAEYLRNAEELAAITGEMPVAMSHPCNSYNAQTLRILRKMGVKVGFRANMAATQFSELEWPREDHANLMLRMAGQAAA